jgi:TPR repeat protein
MSLKTPISNTTADLARIYEAAMASRKDNAQAKRLTLDGFFYLLRCYVNGFDEKDLLRTIERWLSCAEDSDIAEGLYQSGLIYACGVNVEQDDAKAMFFFAEAAAHGYPEARRIVASNARQPEQMLLVTVAECGVAEAQFRLGEMYADGQGVEQDIGKSIAYLEKAAGQGHVEAAYFLGDYLCNKQDHYEKGVELLRQAAERGHIAATYRLYWGDRQDENGQDLAQDREKTEKWFRKATNSWDADEQERRMPCRRKRRSAKYHLGILYDDAPGHVHDYAVAASWYRQAAEQGLPEAVARLGTMYYLGHGVEQSDEKAAECFERAAKDGNSWAQDYLGEMHEQGLVVAKDEEKAAYWYKKAAKKGHASAQYHLALLYESGRGVEKNPVEARKWFDQAAAQGVREKQGLALLQRKLEPNEAGETSMRPFHLITSRDTDLFPWEGLSEYEHLMSVDWREGEDWIVHCFCQATGLSEEGLVLTWDNEAESMRFTYPGGVIDIKQSEEASSQHGMVAALQTAFGATHSIRYLSHFEGSDTVYFVVETHATWQYLEANNPHVPWFFTPIEQIPDVFRASWEALVAAAERYYSTRRPDKP